MKQYQHILVVADPTTEDQKALKRAVELAFKTGSSITVFLSIFDFSYEMTTMLSSDEREIMRQSVIDDRQQWLDELIEKIPHESLTIHNKVVWHHRPFEAIIEEVIAEKYDLVIKGTHQHDKLKSVIFTPTDWHILRKCPSPVLLVKEHRWPENGNILASVNIGSDEDEHQSLNDKITQTAQKFAEFLKGNVHLVNAYPGTPVNISIEIPEFNLMEYNDTMLKQHQNSMEAHAKRFGIDEQHTYVKQGLPESVIDEMSAELDAELVVLGTVGRTGLSAALIGNTAEHVIDRLNCDVLALKPDDYISPFES